MAGVTVERARGRLAAVSRGPVAVAVACALPFLACLALRPFREDIANTNAALVLVLVIVAIGATGNRAAGIVAALSSALWFDFFLTEPFDRFTIADRTDVETTVLLLAVGVGVTELAAWGYRQQARAAREAGYLSGVQAAATVMVTGSSSDLVDAVRLQLLGLLGLRACRFEHGVAGVGHPARLTGDGSVEWRGQEWDVEARGLPVEPEIELLAESRGRLVGRFMLQAAPGSRPTLEQRLVAVTLADQTGAALG
jgi:hypothetical protein